MSARKRTTSGVSGALLGFVGMSVVAGLLVTAAVTPAVAVTGMAANDTIGVFEGLPEYLKLDQLPQVTTVYAKDGKKDKKIASFYSQNRVAVDWDDISQYAKDAATSGEDPDFYKHGGISIRGTVRGAIQTFINGDTQGGSTITQQYVKNVLVQKCEVYNVNDKAKQKKYRDCYHEATDTTIDRKLREMKMAIGLEKKYSKKQILLGYLNIAGFGGRIYGIQSAAEYYYDVSAKDLTAAQAASLIAIVQNPERNRLDKPKDKVNGKKNGYAADKTRRDYILDRMLQYKKITQKEHDKAIKTPIKPKITPQANGCMQANKYDAGTFCSYIENVIENDPAFGKTESERYASLLKGGFKIYTTLDLKLQKTAQDALSDYVPSHKKGMDLGGASVSVQQNTGRILTMVQNRKFNNTPDAAKHHETSLNYAVDAKYGRSQGFQTGSTYKAFDLAAWLEEGHALYDTVDAGHHSFPMSMFHSSCDSFSGPAWNVANDEGGGAGRMSVLNATKYSVNTAFAMMATKTDMCNIKNIATSLGVTRGDGTPLHDNPASVLGTQDISPLTMAVAYAGFANKGKVCTPIAIDKIVNPDGSNRPVTKTKCTQAIDPDVAAGVAYALRTPLQPGGTAQSANPRDGVPMLAKTGTTDGAWQNWLVTSTTKVATATWIGNVQQVKPKGASHYKYIDMHYVYFKGPDGYYRAGNNIKFPVVKRITTALNKRFGGDEFQKPPSTMLYGVQVTIPDVTGKTPDEAKSILEGVGFSFIDGGQVDGAQQAGTVERTDPAAGGKTSKGSAIVVYTSKGNQVKVPDASAIIGQSLQNAQAALDGFTVKVEGGDGNPDDIVTGMSPDGGSTVKPGSTVTLTLTAADDSDDHGDQHGNSDQHDNGDSGHRGDDGD